MSREGPCGIPVYPIGHEEQTASAYRHVTSQDGEAARERRTSASVHLMTIRGEDSLTIVAATPQSSKLQHMSSQASGLGNNRSRHPLN